MPKLAGFMALFRKLWFSLLAVAAFTSARAIERDFKQTFVVQPGCTLKIDTYRGGIIVTEGDQPEIRVTALMEIGVETEAEADRLREALKLEISEENNTVSIRARNPRETRVRFVWNDKLQIDLAWRITVPRQCNVDLKTLNGGITVGNLSGRVVVRAETGAVYLKRIEGSIDARTETGDIIISRCTGAAKASVMRGTIRVGTMGGPTELKTTSGDIEILAARAGLVASAEAGDVIVGFPRDFAGDARVTTSGGSIYAKIDPAASCTVTASSVWGRVENTLALEVAPGAASKRKLTGKLGAGASPITLHADGGHVKLTKGETYFEPNEDLVAEPTMRAPSPRRSK